MVFQAISISAIVFFLWICFRESMIFGQLGLTNWFKKVLPEKIWKPVFDCPFCMCPWYGSLLYLIFFHTSISEWIITVGTASGLITFFSYAYSARVDIEHIAEKYTEEPENFKEHQKTEL